MKSNQSLASGHRAFREFIAKPPTSPKPDKVMTAEEYLAANIKGWHSVCWNVDGFGNVGVRYTPEREKTSHWQFFNWPEILREAQMRLEEQRKVNHVRGEVDLEKSTLEYWTAWCAHANAASCLIAD